MSSILKALKKLEHEKSGRLQDPLKIDSDILRANDSYRSFTPFVTALLFLLVFGGGAMVAFFFMKETKAPQATATSQQAVVSTVLQAPTTAPAASPKTLPARAVVVSAHKESSRETSHKQQKSAAADIVSGTPEKPTATSSAVHKELPAAAIPTLRINGIAFQNSAADSMAIVNGVPVSSGSVIEGVTVKEVHKDHVSFQYNGERFEIQLGQSNR